MVKNSIFGIVFNLFITAAIAILLSTAISMAIYPEISDDKVTEAEFVSMLSDKESNKINKIIQSNNNFYVEFKNKEEIIEITDITEQNMFVNLAPYPFLPPVILFSFWDYFNRPNSIGSLLFS